MILAIEGHPKDLAMRAKKNVSWNNQTSAEAAFMGEDTAAAFVKAINSPGTITTDLHVHE